MCQPCHIIAGKMGKKDYDERKAKKRHLHEKADRKILVKLRPVVNFINILRPYFLYESLFGSIF